MFKKRTIEDPLQIRKQMDQMSMNHEFFLLVRQQKYEQALAIGMMYLKYHPENQAIRKFCNFIQFNRQELANMLEEEQYETDEEEDQEDDEEEQDSEDEDDKSSVFSEISAASIKSKASMKSVKSVASSKSSASKESTKGLGNKENSKINPKHQWQHKCKNVSCPNKKTK